MLTGILPGGFEFVDEGITDEEAFVWFAGYLNKSPRELPFDFNMH